MTPKYLQKVVKVLSDQGVTFASGLTDNEITVVESAHGFRFPPDLRSLLQYRLPIGDRFPNWRDPTSDFIRDQLDWPADGMCFDIEHNSFWISAWGPKPESLQEAQTKARDAVHAAPPLIPVFGHRYLPAEPCDVSNPVFSVYQTDIVCYGPDLPSYLDAEFDVPNPFMIPRAPRVIEFWSQIAG